MKNSVKVLCLLCVLVIAVMSLAGCATNPLTQRVEVNKVIKEDLEYTIGSLSKTGWQLEIPENVFDEEVKLNMQVLTENQAREMESSGFEFVGTPVAITVGNEDSVRLNNPVSIAMQIPKDIEINKENVDDYVVAYHNSDSWEYIFPDYSGIEDGFISFNTYHFSTYSTVKLSDEEKIKLYTEKMALQVWEDEQRENALSDKVQSMFNEAFEKMGISDSTMQGKLFRSIAKEDDYGALLVAAERGDVADFGVKCGEMATNSIIKHLKLEKVLMNKFAAKGAAVATGLSKAAIQVYDGNYTDAAKELTSAFIGYFPAGKAFQATVEIIDAGISTWKDYEMDAAYKSYAGLAKPGAYGYKIEQEDWETLLIQMRGYLNKVQDDAKNTYCAVNGITRKELDKDKALSQRIADNAAQNLRKQFEYRMKNEQDIKQREIEYSKIIEGFKNSLLLERGTFGFDFGMDIQDRLRTLFSVRKNILDIFDGEMPVLNTGGSSEANLNEAITKWISLGSKNRGEFYKWLEEKGYINTDEASMGKFAWVLNSADTKTYDGKEGVDSKNKDGVYQVSASSAPGSYSYTWKYLGEGDTYYDPDLLAGENSTSKCTFSEPPSIIQGGETVTLSLELYFGDQLLSYYSDNASANADFDKWDVEPGYATGDSMPFVNKDGKKHFKIDTYETVKVYSINETISATAPTGSEEGAKIALRTVFYAGVQQGTCYIYEWKQIE